MEHIMSALKSVAKKLINKTGYELVKIDAKGVRKAYNPYSSLPAMKDKVVDLESVTEIAATIPGMISAQSGQIAYTLCYFQAELGDVVEIGSWQGRSGSFLARATYESGNGQCYAIDHFKGNPGREHYYVVEKEDLSDLRDGFVSNIKRVGLGDKLNLLDMPNDQAADVLADKKIRFLLIDGDHTKEGVQKDVDLFFPLLVDGAIVLFDDYSKRFTGLMEVIDDLMARGVNSRIFTYKNSLVLKFRK